MLWHPGPVRNTLSSHVTFSKCTLSGLLQAQARLPSSRESWHVYGSSRLCFHVLRAKSTQLTKRLWTGDLHPNERVAAQP